MLKNTHNTCAIKFSDTFTKGEDNYCVFEVNEQLISTLLQEGTFQIKGNNGNEDAILTTSNKSYKLQKRLFSNSFLFATHEPASSEGDAHLEVHTLKDYLLEVIPHAPQYDQVCNFLFETRIKEEDNMDLMEAGHLFDDLLVKFQISEEELKNMLQNINACNVGNRWFLIDESYLIEVFHEILFQLRAREFNFVDEIPYPQLITELQLNRPRDIVLNAMQNYMELTNGVGDQLMFRISYDAVCKVFAKQLLLAKDNYFYDEFRQALHEAIDKFCPRTLYDNMMEEEKERIENSCFTSFALLVEENNLSLKNYSKEKLYIKYVNKMLLPADFKGRLKKLFKIKTRYFYEELHQWLKDLVKSTKELDELLLKNTRAINEKLSKNIYPIFADFFKIYMKNVVEDKSSKGQSYDIKFYLNK